MKNKAFSIVKSVLSVATIPLWFVKIFVGVGHLPDQNGEIRKVIFRHSMFENICDGFSPAPFWIFVGLASLSALLNLLVLKSNNKKVSLVANIAFGITVVAFVVLLLHASAVGRGY